MRAPYIIVNLIEREGKMLTVNVVAFWVPLVPEHLHVADLQVTMKLD
jgi:hypothetical protein